MYMAHKRPLQDDDSNDNAPEEKRPRSSMQSVVLEAVKHNNTMKLWAWLEPLIRRVVSEEVERAIVKFIPPKHALRVARKHIQGMDLKILRLQFQTKLALPLFTGSKLEGENGSAIQIVLQDATTGQLVTAGDAASSKLDVVVLEGDFATDNEEDWTSEEFQIHEVKEREGKRPLLTGELVLTLKEGVGTLGELIFTDNSSWIRSRKFRLGVKVSDGYLKGVRVREAKTEAFNVKDHRGELYKKHYPPNLKDDVWRLEKIGKDGAYYKRLLEQKIFTVEDFLVLYSTAPSKLREIFGNTMSTKTWDSIIEHAKTCILDETQHVYYPDVSHSIGVILNTIYQPLGIVRNGSYVPSSSLSDTEQVYMDSLVQEAYNDLSSLCTFSVREGHHESGALNRNKDLMYGEVFQQVPNSKTVSQRDGSMHSFPAGGYDGSNYVENSQLPIMQQRDQFQQFLEQMATRNVSDSVTPSFTVSAGYPHNMSHNELLSSRLSLGIQQSVLNGAYSSDSLEKFLAGGLYQQREIVPGGQDGLFNQYGSDMPYDFGQGRGYGLWGNDEVQSPQNANNGDQTLGFWGNSVLQEDSEFPIANQSVSRSYSSGRRSSSRRAYMGWIKLKAALKWVYFNRKKMASRKQVQIEELDDD